MKFYNIIFKGHDDKIKLRAYRFAELYTDKFDIPLQPYKNKTTKTESELFIAFKNKVLSWEKTLKTMLSKLDKDLAWRIINLEPKLFKPYEKAYENGDWLSFTDYLVLRRDIENCSPEELGCLVQLHTLIQNKIDKKNSNGFI